MPNRWGVAINGRWLEFPELFNKRVRGEGTGISGKECGIFVTFSLNVGGVDAISKQVVGHRFENFKQSTQL